MGVIVGFGAAMAVEAGRLGISAAVRSGLKQTHKFGMSGLPQTELERHIDNRWEPAKRLGRRPAMQFLGPGEEKVTLKGVIFPPYYGSFESLEQLRNESMLGFPRPMVTGYGSYHGLWCIKSIKDTQVHYWPNGQPRKVDFTIDLVHYGEDGFGLGFSLFSGLTGLGSIVGAAGSIAGAISGAAGVSLSAGGISMSGQVGSGGLSAGAGVNMKIF